MSVDGLVVREARAADLAAVILLEQETTQAPHWGEAEYRAIVDGAAASEFTEGAVRRCLMVGEADGRLVGFAVGKVMGLAGDALGELESVAVDALARRSGVGRALCEAVVRWCEGQGAVAVELEVRVGSGGAIALYEGLGFVAVGRRRAYYRAPVEDALVMQLELVV